VLSYIDVLLHESRSASGWRSSARGASAFDVAEYLVTAAGHSPTLDLASGCRVGCRRPARVRGGVVRAAAGAAGAPRDAAAAQGRQARQGPGQDHGWIHRAALQMKQVEMIGGVNYERITPQGLFVTYGDKRSDGQ
jgi:2,4-dienoyl-CoA reductase (NADPH2)